MELKSLEISDVVLISPRKFSDDRGYFMETFRENVLSEFVGRDVKFVQDNQSFSIHTSTVRGLHFQKPLPYVRLMLDFQYPTFRLY